MRHRLGSLVALWALLGSQACVPNPELPAPSHLADSHLDRSDLDLSVAPATDFYRYANGGWLKKHPLAANQTTVNRFAPGQGPGPLVEILESLANAETPAGSQRRKLADFYRSGLDVTAIDELGLKPLETALSEIASVGDASELARQVARLHLRGVRPYFRVGTTLSPNGNREVLTELHQTELGLAVAKAYGAQEPDARARRAAYLDYLASIFSLLGDTPELAARNARAVVELEARLAAVALSPAQVRDPGQTYHLVTFKQLEKLAPNSDWNGYFQELGLDPPSRINLTSTDYFRALDRELSGHKLDQQRAYLRWIVVRELSDTLPSTFLQARAAFRTKAFGAAPELPPRKQAVARMVNQKMGMALGIWPETPLDEPPKLGVLFDMVFGFEWRTMPLCFVKIVKDVCSQSGISI